MPNSGTPEHLSTVGRFGADFSLNHENIRYRPIYELSDTDFLIRDPVWGDELIGNEPFDQVLVDLAHSDALRRLQTIEQLTLPDRYSTVPDAAYFSRWEHAWGSMVFVRRMAREMGMDATDATYLQLKVLLSDFKHTAFSHAGDWMFQTEGGPENDHEDRQDYAEVVGVCRLLQLHGFSSDRVFDDKTQDITDMKQPSLDGDRIDYTLREAFRWVDQSPVLRRYLNSDSFTVVDGQIVMKDLMGARMMAMAHCLLVTEYWHDPVERLQLNLFLESLKRIFVCSNGDSNEWGSYSPRDLMNTSDNTLLDRLGQHDPFVHVLDSIMVAVAESEKNKHWRDRRDHLRQSLEVAAGESAGRVDWVKDYYDILPSSCEVEEQKPGGRQQSNKRMVVIPLPAHRERYVDPAFIDTSGNVVQLSEADPEFWAVLQTMREPTRKNWRGYLVQNVATTTMLQDCFQRNDELWPTIMKRPRLPSDAVRMLLRQTVENSVAYASRFIDLTIR